MSNLKTTDLEKKQVSEEQVKAKTIESLLIQKGIVTPNQVHMARFTSRIDTDMSFTDAIFSLGFASEIEILTIISKENGYSDDQIIPFLRDCDWEKLRSHDDGGLSYRLSWSNSKSRNHIVFDYYEEDGKTVVCIAISDPLDTGAIEKTSDYYYDMGFSTKFFVTTKISMALAQKNIYESESTYEERFIELIKEMRSGVSISSQQGASYSTDNSGGGGKIYELLNLVFEYAALENASDVLMDIKEYSEDLCHIYFMINRKKQHKLSMPQDIGVRLSKAIKNRSGMQAGKLTGHQDGAIGIRILDGSYFLDVRVSSIGTITGQQLVMRIQSEEKKELSQLGIKPHHVKRIREEVFKLKGIVVLSGVTGSGKTTTLYSMLSEFDADCYNIITMEDPVEIRAKNVNQIQINNDGGQSFSDSIRACLRQAPHIILLGEIRDAETAFRAVEMALTGHLVLTTIHASDISMISTRLEDLGVKSVDAFIRNITVGIHQELVAVDNDGRGEKMALEYQIGFDGLKDIEKVTYDK